MYYAERKIGIPPTGATPALPQQAMVRVGVSKSFAFGCTSGIVHKQELFRRKAEDNGSEIRVWITFVEIYNEKIRDLLAAGKDTEEMKATSIVW